MPKYGLKQAKKSPTWQLNLGNFQSPGKSPDFYLKNHQKKISAFSPQHCQKKGFLNVDFQCCGRARSCARALSFDSARKS